LEGFISVAPRIDMIEVTPVGVGPPASMRGTVALRAELVAAPAMTAWRDAWTDLATRCLEDDVFLQPGFALAAIDHLPGQSDVEFLLVHRPGADGEAELVGLLALQPTRPGLPFLRRSWWHDNACLGGPMLDATLAGAALDTMLDWLAAQRPWVAMLTLRELQTEGPTAGLLQARIAERRLPFQIRNIRTRAAFDARTELGRQATAGLSAHRRKRLRQHMRHLESLGELTYEQAIEADEVMRVLEEFLALEASGWKGRAGSAFLNHAGKARFMRTVAAALNNGGMRLDALRLDGRAIAIGLILRAGSRAYFWKIAYDEAHAAHSPGVQLVFRIMRAQADDPSISLTDSCAVSNHRMIETIWPGRIRFGDVALAPSPGRAHAFRAILALADARRSLRTLAASLLQKLRRSS
jgi:CelD/BcsL family acetyltransferase involved in cellulose biosynthesis